MKLVFTLLTLALALLSMPSTIAAQSDPVLDTDGNELQPGTPYNILRVSQGYVSIGEEIPNSDPCAQRVVQHRLIRGPTPVLFYPANDSDTVVRDSTYLNIKFNIPNNCSNVWKINVEDGSEDFLYITTGGQLGNPGCLTVNNWFQIVPTNGSEPGKSYDLIFNPGVCILSGNCTTVKITASGFVFNNKLYANADRNILKFTIHAKFEKVKPKPEPILKQVV